MDANWLLIWIAVAWSGMVLLRSRGIAPAEDAWGWRLPALLVLAGTGLAGLLAPDAAGLVGFGLALLLLVLPGVLGNLVARQSTAQRYAAARTTALALRALHPFGPWRRQPALLAALDLAARGRTDAAVAALDAIRNARPAGDPIALAAALHRAALTEGWEDLLRKWPPFRTGAADPNIPGLYLRALGETGRLEEMADTYAALAAARPPPSAALLDLARLSLFAFCGRGRAVAQLLRARLGAMPAEARALWQGTADLAAGDPAARARLQALAERAASPLVRRSASLRLAWGVRPADTLSGAGRGIVDAAEAEFLDSVAGGRGAASLAGGRAGWARAPVTLALIAANCAVFLAELARGGRLDTTLYQLGGLWPDAVLRGGEWWRVGAALFLHAGWAHLGANMLALLALGSDLERVLGPARFLLAYAASGIGSMVLILVLGAAGAIRPEMVVGASGAIMGLVGVAGALALRMWLRHHSGAARQQVGRIVWVVVLQSAFDLATPQVSMAAHLNGLLIGALVGAALVAAPPRRPRAG